MESARRALGLVDDAVFAIERLFLIAVTGAITVLVVAGVVFRYAFNDPLTWSEELIVGLFTWLVFIGAAIGVRAHAHIRIDVMAPVYANPKMHWLNLVTLLVGLAVLGLMIYACWTQVMLEAVVDLPMLDISKAWFLSAMPAGLVFMVLHALRIWVDRGAAAVFRGDIETAIEKELGQ
jgi:TRAP-type C4-dicarboxylate transport system permease small subunit